LAGSAAGSTLVNPSERTIQPWFSATAQLSGTCDGIPRSGGSSGRSLRLTMPVCCWVSPDHRVTSIGSDTVGNPTSTMAETPRPHSPCHVVSVEATSADSPSISTTRVRDVADSPGPAPPGIAAGSLGTASQLVTS